MKTTTETKFKQTELGRIPKDWEMRELKSLCVKEGGIQTGPFGSQLHNRDYVDQGTPIITVEHLGENRILHENLPKVSENDRRRLVRYSLREGDIVFSRVGSVDRRAIVKKSEDGWLFSGRCLRVRVNKDVVDPSFLSYYFGFDQFRERIRGYAVGATMPSLNTKLLSEMNVIFPPMNEQVAIARILSVLDAKIELIEQMNKTLEAIGKAIFKHWFIDFEFPNEEGTPYKSSGGEMAHNEELGREIPKGWEVGTVQDLSELNPETWSENTAPNEIKYVDLSNTKWGKIEQTQRYLWKDAPSRAQRVLRPGDTIIGTVRPGNGSFSLVGEEGLTGSTGFAVLRPRKEIYEKFVYMISTSAENIERLSHLADGAAYPAVRPDVVLATQTVLPPGSLMERFASVANPIMTKMSYNDKESSILAALRDGLLPKLMSGKIRVTAEVR
jgi:type I restriction enzyme S subunit